MEDNTRDAIRAACEQLDADRDDHWTTDGRPAVAAVRLLAGDDSITRATIERSNPGCHRVQSGAPEPTLEQIEDEIEAVKEYMRLVRVEEVDARRKYREADAALSELIAKRDAADPLSDDVKFAQHWQRRQIEERERAAAREPGSQATALDQSFATRRSRATYPRAV